MTSWPEYWFYHQALVYATDSHIAFDGRYGNDLRAWNRKPTWKNTIVLPQEVLPQKGK
jgi:hypothetical protein